MFSTVYVPKTGLVSDWQPVVNMFQNEGYEVITSLNDNPVIHLACFTGGSDVHPSWYEEENTHSYPDLDRDVHEYGLYLGFHSIPKVGICRGGQWLNVMAGGKMIQHIEGHSGLSVIVPPVLGDIPAHETVKEDHHQGMVPTPEAEVLYVDANDQNPEVLFYEEEQSLCFQPHPEWGHDETKQLFFDLLKEKFDV